uniref:anti-sigma factor family protein n=1 Tax=Marinobacterium profundum TaxID=1714300 RepID=UPI000830A3F1|nr:zf-HC2 domain-containing protein [Marinobacterium profundum]
MKKTDGSHDNMTDHLSELHLQLQDWLSGYADGELDAQQTLIFEAHLAGCDACRTEIERQQSLSRRLQQVAVNRMPGALHQRLDTMLDEAQHSPAQNAMPRPWLRRLAWARQPAAIGGFIGVTGWALAALLMAVLLLPGTVTSMTPGSIPMMSDVLQEYQNLSRTNLVQQETPPSKTELPARLAGCKLVARWKTRVGGEPAEAFALQRGNHLIIEYRITENVFYRNPNVRQAITDYGDYRIREQQLEVLALPLKGAGLLIVGPAGAMPHRREFIL